MNRDRIVDSLGNVNEKVLWKVASARKYRKPKRAMGRWIAIAACLGMLCSAALTAEATSGSVSNLLIPLFGGAQTEIVDKIGVPIGASTSVNGYTLTADAIIGDRYNVATVYTLSREDGQPIPEGIGFQKWRPGLGGSGGGSLSWVQRDETNPSVAHFIEKIRRQAPLIGRMITSSFSTLVIPNGEGEDSIVAEGTWELTYTLRYPDSSEKLPVKNLLVTDKGGSNYKVKKILLSPVGVHFDLILYDPVFEARKLTDFEVSLRLTDGTVLSLDGGGGGQMTEGDKTMKLRYSAMFDTPISRENIEAIIICGTDFVLENRK